ncbi:MAG: hypothetical protein AAGM84_14740 [Pseudomonadota bacterium]
MTNVIITTDTTTSTIQDLGNATDALFFLGANSSLVSTLNTAVAGDGDDQIYMVEGSLLALGDGILADGTGALITINGNLTAGNTGIVTTGTGSQVHINGAVSSLGLNALTIAGGDSDVVVSQSGSVSSPIFGMRLGGFLSTDFENLTNAGTITGGQVGVAIVSSATITNSGVISKSGDDDFVFGAAAILSYANSSSNLNIFNSGEIIGAVSNGMTATLPPVAILIDAGTATKLDLVNTGTVFGAVQTDTANDIVANSGQITGNLLLDDGLDRVTNTGTILGDIGFGDDNDTYIGAGTGFVSGKVLGQLGNDTLIGSDAADDLEGGDDNDLVSGRGGNDTLFAGAGTDTVLGGEGNDALFGQSGTNILNGQGGNDTINGGSGDDRLLGGNGDDTLNPGTGADLLRGDAGADVFVFGSVADTGTGATRDRILGWEDGADLIDLSGFGTLTFSATGPIGNHTASVWFQSVSGGAQTMLRIDTDGDGSFDGQVLLVRADPALFDQSDLILA